MNIVNAVILGTVEGITEFLPISSTAHLIFASRILHIPQTEFQKFFEVFIQSGAILAVIFLYSKYVFTHKNLVKNIIFSFIPTSVVGLVLYKIIKNVFFESYNLIIGAMVIVGVLFLIIEYLIRNNKLTIKRSIKNISWKQAVVIGFGQSLAVIPGVSRSGIVMVTMMLLGYRRDESAVYSFLLAVPTILAASVLDVYETRQVIINSAGYLPFLLTGFVISFITAYLSVKWLVGYLQKNSLVSFGIYRLVLALVLLI